MNSNCSSAKNVRAPGATETARRVDGRDVLVVASEPSRWRPAPPRRRAEPARRRDGARRGYPPLPARAAEARPTTRQAGGSRASTATGRAPRGRRDAVVAHLPWPDRRVRGQTRRRTRRVRAGRRRASRHHHGGGRARGRQHPPRAHARVRHHTRGVRPEDGAGGTEQGEGDIKTPAGAREGGRRVEPRNATARGGNAGDDVADDVADP